MLTGKNEGDKTEHNAEQPKDETGKHYVRYERLLLGHVLRSGCRLLKLY